MRKFLMPSGVLFLCFVCAGQAAPNVQVGLSLAGDKAVYKAGEPIVLRLTFHASARTQLNTAVSDPASPIDRLVLSPLQGVFPWLADQDHGNPYTPDYALISVIDSGKPQVVELPLNAIYRFDTPGRYSVSVETRRVAPVTLTTNTVTFDIQAMADDEEATRASELEQRIRRAGSAATARKCAEELAWLAGDPSTRVKLALFLRPKAFYPFTVDVTKGLWIARNRALVVEELEKALRDPTQELPFATALLPTLVAMRERLDTAQKSRTEIETGYLKQVAASLPERRGKALITAAQTAFMGLARNNESTPEFNAARETVIAHFAEVNEYSVDLLLNTYGKYLRDPRLVPALKQILAVQTGRGFGLERTAVIRQLMAIAPEESRTELVNEICGDNATVAQIYGEAPFPVLPETDACLWQKIQAAPSAKNRMAFDQAGASIARFAGLGLYDGLFSLYRQSGALWGKQAQGYVLAYLVRWNPERGMPLLEAALPGDAAPLDTEITFALGKAGYVPAIDSFWRERLSGSSPEMEAQAAYQMSENGPAEDRAILRGRLDEWRAQWKGREVPPAEGRVEAELTQAVMRGTHWQAAKKDVQLLASGCVSDVCRTRFALIARQ